jgi:hypothetical protein
LFEFTEAHAAHHHHHEHAAPVYLEDEGEEEYDEDLDPYVPLTASPSIGHQTAPAG